MAKKVKITKAEVSISRENLGIDADIIDKLSKIQEDYQTRFKDKIDKARADALAGFNARIELLKKAKTDTLNNYTNEIKRFDNIVKTLQAESKAVKTQSKKKV